MDQQKKLIDDVLSTIVNEDIRAFATVLVEDFPEYIWEVPASSSGRFHPLHDQGDGGLIRHLVAVARVLNYIFELEQFNSRFTDREVDLMRVAALVHDGRKSGEQVDYEKSKSTKFEHPMLMAQAVRKHKGSYLTDAEIEIIASSVEAHMGQWNTSKRASFDLPKPTNTYQKFVHLADYLASRKGWNMEFEDWTPAEIKLPDIHTYQIGFGKHSGKTIPEIAQVDYGWLTWAANNLTRQPEQTLIKNYLKEGTKV